MVHAHTTHRPTQRRRWAHFVLVFALVLGTTSGLLPAASAAGPDAASGNRIAAAPAAPDAATVTVTKTQVAPAGRTVLFIGETATFQVVVRNTGDTTIAVLPLADVFDDQCLTFNPKASPPESSVNGNTILWADLTVVNGIDLAPGQSFVTTINFDVTGPTGSGLNQATVSGALDVNNAPVTPDPASSQVRFTCVEPPAINVVKTATPSLILNSGAVLYTYQVTNPGGTPLANVSLVDNTCSPLSGPTGDANSNNRLDPNETWTYTCTTTVTVDTTNTVVATGQPTDPTGQPLPVPPVQDSDTAFVDVVNPRIDLVKTADATLVYVGETVLYTYEVTNTGDTPLGQVTVSDDTCVSPAYQSGDVNTNGLLDPGETWVYTCSMAITQDTTNTAVAVGTPTDDNGNPLPGPPGQPVRDQDTETVNVIQPRIAIDKGATPTVIQPGGLVTYAYVVTNPGNDPLSNVTVVDDKCAPVSYVLGDVNNNSLLDPGEVWVYTCVTNLLQDTTNTATASGLDSLGNPVSATDTAFVDVVTTGLQIVKTASATTGYNPTTVTYTYTVDNTGGNPISNVVVSDNRCSPVTYVSGDANNNNLLDANELWTYTCTATLTQDTTNVATVTGRDPFGNPVPPDQDSVTVNIINPAIQVVKTASPTIVLAGGTVVYTYVVTNPGDDPLANVSVTDDRCSPVTGPNPAGDQNNNGLLDPGETWVYTCTTTLTQDTTNTVTAVGDDSLGNPVRDTDQAFVDVVRPAIDLVKTANPAVTLPGGLVQYTFVVTNPGDVPLSNVQLNDDTCAPLTGPAGDVDSDGLLDPAETWTYLCSMPVSQDTTNVATVTGQPSNDNGIPLPGIDPVDDTDEAFVDVVRPGIDLVKDVNRTIVYPGTLVFYTYYVTNTGDTPLNPVTVVDDKCALVLGPFGDNGNGLLDPGETWLYGCTATINVDTTNTATATGQPADAEGLPLPLQPVRDQDTETVDVINPRIAIDKTANPTMVLPGQPVTYTYVVTNPGDDPLSNVVVSDDQCAPVLGPSGDDGDGLLEPGETWTYTCVKTLSQDTVNTATATGRDSLGNPVSATDTAFVDVIIVGLDIVKTASATVVYPNTLVTYTFTVRNTGSDPISNVNVSDDRCAPLAGPTGDDGDLLLEPGEVWTYTCQATLTQDTLNIATVTGRDPLGNPVTPDQDSEQVNVINPAIQIDKSANPAAVLAGGTVVYTFLVTNPGDDPLSGVTVTDDTCSPVVGPNPAGDQNSNGLLDPGETWAYTCTANPTQDTTNVATASGNDSLGNPVRDTDEAFVDVIRPGIDLVKTAEPEIVTLNEIVLYRYYVTNTGDVPLATVSVTDDKCSPLVGPTGDNGNGLLDPGETWYYTCATVITEDTTNTAVASGQPSDPNGQPLPGVGPVSDQDTAFVDLVRPSIDLVKTASDTVVSPGATVIYTYQVTNTGDTTINNPVVSDDRCAPVILLTVDANGLLDPGETWVYTCSAVITQDTLNTALATGQPADPTGVPLPGIPVVEDRDQEFVDVINPALVIEKSANVTQAQPGDVIVYTYLVTNTGDDPLSNVTVTDDRCAPVVLQTVDPNGLLDPGQTWVFTCNYTVRPSDTDPLVNTATATGTDSNGDPVRDTDTHQVTIVPGGSIGDRIWYDIDGDGMQDLGEAGIAGVVVELQDGVCSPTVLKAIDAPCPTVTTDANGNYLFTGLPAGTYTVVVKTNTLPPGLVPTTPPSPLTVVLTTGQVFLNGDFGYAQPVTIGDFAFLDNINTNGIQDPGENTPVPGALVTLVDNVRGTVYNQVTDANGQYLFSGLPPGSYTITAVAPTGLVLTTPVPQTFSLTAGQSDLGRDFGFISTTGVQLLTFTARPLARQVQLNWQVLVQNQGAPEFYVWRSVGGANWQRVSPTAITASSSTGQTASYTYTDRAVTGGTTYLYWLEIVDGGSFGPWQVRVPSGRIFLPAVTRTR